MRRIDVGTRRVFGVRARNTTQFLKRFRFTAIYELHSAEKCGTTPPHFNYEKGSKEVE
jgi:hypothetical protein